jgi:guanine nucleotide-binding protein subunit alpha
MERDEEIYDLLDLDYLNSDGQIATTSTTTDPEIRRIASEKFDEYSAALAPALELEGRLIRILRQNDDDDDDDEATRLGDGSAPGWSTPRGEYAVRTTSNWKRVLSMRRSQSKRTSSTSRRSWEDPSDPVHVLDRSRDSIMRLWNDQWVRCRLVERRVRLQESSGLCVGTLLNETYDVLS